MDAPYITIFTTYPGASPAEIETDIAKRIEDAVVSIDGLKHLTSSCMEDVCQMLLEFELEIDVDDFAGSTIRAAVFVWLVGFVAGHHGQPLDPGRLGYLPDRGHRNVYLDFYHRPLPPQGAGRHPLWLVESTFRTGKSHCHQLIQGSPLHLPS